jgi:hypothetical protein
MKSATDHRRLQRNEVRNISFVELMAVVVFSLLLVVSFSMADLDVAQSNLAAVEMDRDGAKTKLALKIKELAALHKAYDPKKMTRLVPISRLNKQQRLTLEAEEKLKKQKRRKEKLAAALEVEQGKARENDKRTKKLERTNIDLRAKADEAERKLERIGEKVGPGTLDKLENYGKLAAEHAKSKEQIEEKRKQVIDLKAKLQLLEENYTNAKNMLAFVTRSKKGGGGIDNPPCWPAGESRVHPVFKITLYANKALLTPIWPEVRSGDAQSHPIFKQFVNGGELNKKEFLNFVKRVRNYGEKNTDTPCVYYSKMVRGEDSDKKVKTMVGYFGTGFYPVP